MKASSGFLRRQYICADAVLAVVRAGDVIVGHGIAIVRTDVEVFKGWRSISPATNLSQAK